MARGRFISKEISLDEKVDALSDDTARLLFTWMIPHLDVEGRMYGDARLFKSLVAPRRNYSLQKVEKVLTEFEKLGLVVRYEVNKNCYLFAPNFNEHQPGLNKNREAHSRIPPPNSGVNQELIGSNDRQTPSEVEVEDEVEVKVKDEVEETTSFETYKEKLKTDFPVLDIEEEWERCQIWYRDHKKKIKSPSLALGNWCRKEMEIKVSGKSRRDSETKRTTNEDRRASITD